MSTRWPALLACIAALALPHAAHAVPIGTGSVIDPIGDSIGGLPPDIASASLSVESSAATFSVTFAPGTSLADSSADFVLDTDQNPATGFAGVDAAHHDSALIGADYVVQINGSGFQGNAVVRLGTTAAVVGTLPVTYAGLTESVVVPLSLLGGDDGSMNFKVVSQRQLTINSYTGIPDYASDLGLPPVVVQVVPEPATALLLSLGFAALWLGGVVRRRRPGN